MMGRSGGTFLKVFAICVAAVVGFLLFHDAVRAFETRAALWVLGVAGAPGLHAVGPTTVLIVPRSHAAFNVLITPSCSALSSLLAFGCLGSLTARYPLARRATAIATAVGIVASGNVLRIAGSMAIGLVAGRTSLILFHDWVGSMFTLVYTLGGYILMLGLLLRRTAKTPRLLEYDGMVTGVA
jgi:exosortase/archaeosortase family protein